MRQTGPSRNYRSDMTETPSTPIFDRTLRQLSRNGPARDTLIMMLPGLILVCGGSALLAGWKMGVFLAMFCVPMVLLFAASVQLFHVWPSARRIRAVLKRPDAIVWVFSDARTVHRVRHEFLHLGTESGELVELQITSLDEAHIATLYAELRALAPLAHHGYSAELLRKFRADPSSLRRGDAPDPLRELIQRAASAPPPRTEAKLVAAHDCTYDQLSYSLSECGLTLVAGSLRAASDDVEPTAATWLSDAARVEYRFDPQLDLRTLHICGPRAEYVRNDVLNLAYLPVLEARIPEFLDSADRTEVLRALGAIAFLHGGAPGKLYSDRLERLKRHEDEQIRRAALAASG